MLALFKSIWGYAIAMAMSAVALYVGVLKYKDSELENEVKDLKNEKRQSDIKSISDTESNKPLTQLVDESNRDWVKRNDT